MDIQGQLAIYRAKALIGVQAELLQILGCEIDMSVVSALLRKEVSHG